MRFADAADLCTWFAREFIVRSISAGDDAIDARRRAFTLIELLMTISTVAILASLFLGGMNSAQETGRVAVTKATIAKIDNIIMQRWESYRTRRVPLTLLSNPGNPSWSTVAAGQRLDCLRELMRLEMPQTWNDITSGRQTSPPGGWTPIALSSLAQAYLRRYEAIYLQTGKYPTPDNQGAECLYLICTNGISDELDLVGQFRSTEIGDIDSDGALEFADGWGTPIAFVRWAPGFVSEIQTGLDADPFDPQHVYPSVSGAPGAGSVYGPTIGHTAQTFALYPLIFSAGPDKLYGIVTPKISNYASPVVNNDPFFTMSNPGGFGDGLRADVENSPPTLTTVNSADNIHNHLVGTR
jgi:prepilin-type N-terminal cleavage/methylation domain-containing protein